MKVSLGLVVGERVKMNIALAGASRQRLGACENHIRVCVSGSVLVVLSTCDDPDHLF